MEPPDDPLAGFLPPITESGNEVGWVCFQVDPRADLPIGTRIENQALVNFDGVGPYNPAPKEGPFVNTIGIHNIAVADFSPSKTVVGQGFSCSVNTTIVNEGHFTETFNVTLYADSTIIATQTVDDLPNSTYVSIILVWNTTGFAKGNYTLKICAALVIGEKSISDNNSTAQWIVVAMVGDITGPSGWPDGKCDIRDIAQVASKYGRDYPDPGYDSNCDLTGPIRGLADGKIDIRDIANVAKHYGEIDP